MAKKTFDVFLSHNSKDKPTVVQLAEELKKRGLHVWLDVWELVPGRPWQEALEEIIQTAKTAAVLVAKDGLGPWEKPETRGCLSEFASRRMPVIPVLLPGAPKTPNLPLFLKQFTWVDLRGGLSKDELDRLEWGITGKKPEFAQVSEPPRKVDEPEAPARPKILLLGADITGGKFRLDEELERITRALEKAKHGDTVDVVSDLNLTRQEIQVLFRDHRPVLFNFSGHFDTAGQMYLRPEGERRNTIPLAALQEVFRLHGGSVRCVFLNACNSARVARAIVQSVDCVIAMRGRITVDASIEFSDCFYDAIGAGCSVREAFSQARTEIMLAGLPEEDTPELVEREDGIAATIVIAGPQATVATSPKGKDESDRSREERPMGHEDALGIWKEKRARLESELAICSDPEQKFALEKKIEECERQIERLSRPR